MALRARSFMEGIARYQAYPAQRNAAAEPAAVWQSGGVTLRDYAPEAARTAPVVLAVPSLINRAFILDLMPGHSLMRMLASGGMRPVLLDWGEPGQAEKDFSLGDYITQRLLPALHFLAARYGAVHLLGYCLGGLMAVAAASLAAAAVRSLTLLATPWDFHAGYWACAQDGAAIEQSLRPWLDAGEGLPAEVVQGVFTSFQPLHAFHKFSRFAALDPGGVDAKRFVLAEDWLNDGVALTPAVARECFGDLSARNSAAQGKWRVGGLIIDPASIRTPCHMVVPERDRIVPWQSSLSLARALPQSILWQLPMGHIGIMAAAEAPKLIWQPLADWILAH